jgi:predicted lipid-binding transport protein (Tim44 family)
MRRASLVSALVALLVGSGLAIAQTTAPAAKAQPSMPAGHEHGEGMCAGMMGGGMMGGGMGGGMMGGMGPMMMGGPGTKIAVKNVEKGVTITLTSSDPAMATRLQKMAEGMRLMHEAMTPEK